MENSASYGKQAWFSETSNLAPCIACQQPTEQQANNLQLCPTCQELFKSKVVLCCNKCGNTKVVDKTPENMKKIDCIKNMDFAYIYNLYLNTTVIIYPVCPECRDNIMPNTSLQGNS